MSSSKAAETAKHGHHDLIGQLHDQQLAGPVAEAEAVAAYISTGHAPMGKLGARFAPEGTLLHRHDRFSPPTSWQTCPASAR